MEAIMIAIAAMLFAVLSTTTGTSTTARHHNGLPFVDLEARLTRERTIVSNRGW
ncbi:hypothetical protein [Nocardia sp. NBC_01327]|uniref:hypothetical protein n=1 Tax=Nocardia sp. NBC_01327 TaxID=2903593 RepID=UPI002E16150D|nr:hypothetical protein OG326_06030 [Nocardia sp. NBC_01327]